jgi:hypothetical protein
MALVLSEQRSLGINYRKSPRHISKKHFAEYRVASVFIMGAALGEMVLPLMISNLFQIDKLVFVFVSFCQDFCSRSCYIF